MTEIDMLVRDTLADRAESAPNGAGLLTRVQTRWRLIRRRRRVAAAGAGVAAVLLGAGAVPVINGMLAASPSGAGFGGPTATKPVTTDAPTPAVPSGSETPPPPIDAMLAAPSFTLPKVPFRPATGVIPGLPAGVAIYDDYPMIMHNSGENDPLVMLYIGAQPSLEGFTSEATAVTVRGVDGKVYRPTDAAHPGLVLAWTEPDGTPMWISAGNVEPEQALAYANGLTREEMPISAPFSFKELPRGLELQSVNPSDMVFGLPNQVGSWQYKLAFTLGADGGEDAASWPLQVGNHKAKINPQDDGGRMLMVSLPNGNVLSVQVPVNIKISDADLYRMAAGVTVNGGAKAGRG